MRPRFGSVALILVFLASSLPASAEVLQTQTTFNSNGKTILVDQFAPSDSARHPAVIFVHGSDGMRTTAWKYAWSREFATRGYVVLIPHYFASLGEGGGARPGGHQNFALYLATLGDTVDFAARQPGVDSARLGLMGYSLGGYLSLALGARDDRIKTVVEFFGGMPAFAARSLHRMPPTLILHGEADPVVPVARAYELENLFKANGVLYEIKIYPGQGHGFTGEADLDSRRRTMSFFDKYLPPGAAAYFTKQMKHFR